MLITEVQNWFGLVFLAETCFNSFDRTSSLVLSFSIVLSLYKRDTIRLAVLLMPSCCMASQKQYGCNFPLFRSSADDTSQIATAKSNEAELSSVSPSSFALTTNELRNRGKLQSCFLTCHARGDTQFESGKCESDIVSFEVD